MARQYGLGGGGLAGMGMDQQKQAVGLLGAAAEQEQARNLNNMQMEQQRKAGNTSLGAAGGAIAGFVAGGQIGAVGGPVGAMIGGTIGAIAGGLFACVMVVGLIADSGIF
jgi:phage tail tape-measure protein